MFVIMDEFSPWPPVNCNDCRNVSCTEAEQEKAMGKPPHICREYKKRVFHVTNKRGFHSCLHPCVDCIKDRFRKFESRGENVMTINVSDLPPKYQAQAMKKYMEQQQRRGPAPPAAPPQDPAKGTKYHNTPTERVTASGAVLHFDSQKEARRFDVLAARQARGQIRDLRLQVDFTLQEAFTDTEGKRVRAIRYKADFTYYQPPNRQLYGSHAPYYAEQSGAPWEFVVEDVKSKATRTAKYAMKKKMLKDRFGYDITEV